MSTHSNALRFPDWYPPECPPLAAEDAHGVVFRFATKKPVAAEDFLTHHELGIRRLGLRPAVGAAYQFTGQSARH